MRCRLAGDAVLITPVSKPNSLPTENFQGISQNRALERTASLRETPAPQRFLRQFPKREQQGNYSREQGNWHVKQRKSDEGARLSAKSEMDDRAAAYVGSSPKRRPSAGSTALRLWGRVADNNSHGARRVSQYSRCDSGGYIGPPL